MKIIRPLITLGVSMSVCLLSFAADLNVDKGEVSRESIIDTKAVVKPGAILRLTGTTPLVNSTVDLTDNSSQLIFEGLLPSEVEKDFLKYVTVGGRAFDPAKDRLGLYGNGSEIIADGMSAPLTVYTEANYGGQSKVCDQDKFYREKKMTKFNKYLPTELLGDFNNNIRSFKLRRGYSATFANNLDGTGYSRVFTAFNEDLEVPVMPEGLDFVSFIRVCRVDRVGKRGICGLDVTGITRSTWYYSWGASDEPGQDWEFIPMRHNRSWDGFDRIGSRTNTSNALGHNEPDHADQASMSQYDCLRQWPDLLGSGLRLGSPAPDAINKDWLRKFIQMADSLNYRVDFVATHMYWNNQTPKGLTDNINNLCRNNYGGRPMWITEWNNGANWTGESWPDREGVRLDAEFNILLDKDGKQTTVKRPHTKANSDKQVAWLTDMLKAFDECPFLERHAFYNWVEDARSVEIDGKLTPAGKVFAAFRSRPGFDPEVQYEHEWRIAPPLPRKITNNGLPTICFDDLNGETGVNYIVERKIDNGEWKEYKVLENGVDYKKPMGLVYVEMARDVVGKHKYRIKATSYKGGESIYSRIITFVVDASGVEDIIAPSASFSASVKDGALVVSSDVPASYQLYRPDGRMVRVVNCNGEESTVIDGLDRGIYIINGVKVAI